MEIVQESHNCGAQEEVKEEAREGSRTYDSGPRPSIVVIGSRPKRINGGC